MGKIIIVLFCAYMAWHFVHKFSTTPNLNGVEQLIIISFAALFGLLGIFTLIKLIASRD